MFQPIPINYEKIKGRIFKYEKHLNLQQKIQRLALSVFLFSFLVVIVGAYTRLTDAGLGCPDWPTCYHHLILPSDSKAVEKAQSLYPAFPLHTTKAWTEMLHRYIASILGLLVFVLAFLLIKHRKPFKVPLLLPFMLVALVLFQGLLGKWTVTMRLLPIVVMGHLIGGFTLLSLLWLSYLYTSRKPSLKTYHIHSFKPWAFTALILAGLQISLGGWTSANYAGIICPNFPFCTADSFFPTLTFTQAFDFFHITPSYAAKVTIQMFHRFGALILAIYLGLLAGKLLGKKSSLPLKKFGMIIITITVLQFILGIMNVVLLLPITIALLHSMVAAILLLCIVSLNFYLYTKEF